MISILNNAQREWLNKKKDFIDQQISKFYPLTDEQWQHVTDIVDDTVKKAKGHEAEVRKELFDLMEKWERKEKEGVRDVMHLQERKSGCSHLDIPRVN